IHPPRVPHTSAAGADDGAGRVARVCAHGTGHRARGGSAEAAGDGGHRRDRLVQPPDAAGPAGALPTAAPQRGWAAAPGAMNVLPAAAGVMSFRGTPSNLSSVSRVTRDFSEYLGMTNKRWRRSVVARSRLSQRVGMVQRPEAAVARREAAD